LVDYLTPEDRSVLMSKIRGKHTRPEMVVRSVVYSLGYRYRLHCRDLPGTPDIVFRRLRKIIFIHGCFWHRHKRCPQAYTPKSRQAFWRKKFRGTRLRDRRHLIQLKKDGWDVLIIWECELDSIKSASSKIKGFLARRPRSGLSRTRHQ
jgi:DNA mismatch endonuclease, patch repair protein